MVRLALREIPERPANLRALRTSALVEQLWDPNPWRRTTARHLLVERTYWPDARGLHPTTAVHLALKQTDPQIRLEALWALNAMKLLEDDHLEDAYQDLDPWVQGWSARLVGERRLPTSMAFQVMEKLARHTNAWVRSAVAVAARQFVSGSLTLDTPPVIPIREVFTGGVLSGLWFAGGSADDPVMNQQYWNAVRPIASFDPVHPLDFFRGKQDAPTPLAAYVLRKLAAQVAATGDPQKFEVGLVALRDIEPGSIGQVRAALQGLLDGSGGGRSGSGPAQKAILERFRSVDDAEVRALAEQLEKKWSGAGMGRQSARD
jgi:hypothetical protein